MKGETMKYTYDQFEKALKESGHKFSDSDLALASKNPDVGMTLLQYKKDYSTAKTAEARALANHGAEALRKKYGGYRGGDDGSKFYLDENTAPTYDDSYADKKKELMDAILNRKEFSYDPSTDPSAQAYEKQYAREGKRATDNVMASAAAATGGMPSSFAVSAAQQAGNQYAAQMADKIPELERMAYDRYLQDLGMKRSDLQMVEGASKAEYGQFLDKLNQYNADRNFEHIQNQDKLAQQNADRNFEYMQNQDKQNREYQLAMLKAQHGDYSGLKALGVDTSAIEAEQAAKAAARSYSSGGGGGGGRGGGSGYSSGGDTWEETSSGGLSIDAVNSLLNDYPDGMVPESQWRQLVSQYGEDVLRNAGFYVGGHRKPNVIHKQNGAMDYTIEEW